MLWAGKLPDWARRPAPCVSNSKRPVGTGITAGSAPKFVASDRIAPSPRRQLAATAPAPQARASIAAAPSSRGTISAMRSAISR